MSAASAAALTQGTRDARFTSAATEQATKERLENRRQNELEAFQLAGKAASGQQQSLESATALIGTCEDMCPEYEREKRQRESAVDSWEKDPETGRIDPAKAVKAYQRPSGQTILPSDVRPPRVLILTLDYLLHDVLPAAPLLNAYSFIWDRMRSIRQDLTLQGSRGREAIVVLERIARFHAIAVHELRGQVTFNAKLCNDALNGTLKSLIEFYTEARQRGEAPSPNEAEFYSYYLAFAYSPGTLYDISQLPKLVLDEPLLQTTLRLCALSEHNNRKSGAHVGRNAELSMNAFTRFFKQIASYDTPYLLACIFEERFADVRLGALKTLKRAYTLRTELSLVELAQWIGCDDDIHCAAVCRDFDVELVEEEDIPISAVLFVKARELDEHLKKLLPSGQPSRRLIDIKKRGARFADLCDGKTGIAPRTPVAAPVARFAGPSSSPAPQSPVKIVSDTFEYRPAPISFTAPSTTTSSLPRSFKFSPSAKPFQPSLPQKAPPSQPNVDLRSSPVASKPITPDAIETPSPPHVKPAAPTPRRDMSSPSSEHRALSLSASGRLKRKASHSVASPPRASPKPAAVLRRQRLDAYVTPLLERLLEAGIDIVVQDAAIASRLDISSERMMLQQRYRESVIKICADKLVDTLIDDAVAQAACSSRVDRRILSETFDKWLSRYDQACDDQERREQYDKDFRSAAEYIGARHQTRSAVKLRDLDELLRLGTLDIGLDVSYEDSVLELDSPIPEEKAAEAGLWQPGSFVQPLLRRADASDTDNAWGALVSVQSRESLNSDWWRCKLDLPNDIDTKTVSPLEIHMSDSTPPPSQSLKHTGLVLLDAETATKESSDDAHSRLESLVLQIEQHCLYRPDLVLILWWSALDPPAQLASGIVSLLARSVFGRVSFVCVGDGTTIDQDFATEVLASIGPPLRNLKRPADQQINFLLRPFAERWLWGCRRVLTLCSLSPPADLLTVVHRYVDLYKSVCTKLLDVLSVDPPIDFLPGGLNKRDNAGGFRSTLASQLQQISSEQYGFFQQALEMISPMDDVTLAQSFLEHIQLYIATRLTGISVPTTPAERLEPVYAVMEQSLRIAYAQTKREVQSRTPPPARQVKRPSTSPGHLSGMDPSKRSRNNEPPVAVRVGLTELTSVVKQARSLLSPTK